MPVETLSAAALPRDSSACPRRQPMNTASIVASTSATWFGPTAPASPNRKYDSPTSAMRLATGTIASVSVTGCGSAARFMRDIPRSPGRPGPEHRGGGSR